MKQVEKTQIEKWAGNLKLWTPPCSSVSCSLSRMLILFSESYHKVTFDGTLVGVANWLLQIRASFLH